MNSDGVSEHTERSTEAAAEMLSVVNDDDTTRTNAMCAEGERRAVVALDELVNAHQFHACEASSGARAR